MESHHCGPHRSQSLPGLGIPAGFSSQLGNKLSLAAYANLRGSYHARFDAPPHAPAPNRGARDAYKAKVELGWVAPERMRPELQPPAGGIKEIKRGKRLVPDNTNTMSHVDTLLFGVDIDGSDGILRQGDTATYRGSAGINAKGERTMIYGDGAPVCLRTFGENGTTGWENPRGAHQRVDPRSIKTEDELRQY